MIRRLLGASIAAVIVAMVLTSTPSSAFPPARPTRVLVLGDSVMKGAAGAIGPALPGREVVVDAEVNRSTGQGADVVARLGSDWDVVVVLLGHNDGGSPGAYQPAARRILDQLRGVPAVSWLTIHEVRDYYPGVNHYIAGLQGEYPNLRVGDWNAIASANPGALSSDGLHLNGTGASLMAGLVAEQVEDAEGDWATALRSLGATTTTTTAPPTTTSTTTTTTTTTTTPTTTTAEPSSDGASLDPAPDAAVAGEQPGDDALDTDDKERNVLLAGSVVVWATVAVWGVRRLRARRTGAEPEDDQLSG